MQFQIRKAHLLTATAGLALMLGMQDVLAAEADAVGSEEIIVTARRRAEVLSTTPVAITAFTSQKLDQLNVHSTQDLQKLTPGVVFSDTGTPANTTFSIRGQGRFVIGSALPSVLSYFNEVPLGSWGSVLPTFDLGNIQILKGPQGTLFGRNTTGGAVLIYSQAPTYDFEGYIQGLYGSYNWGDVQGAINIPVIKNKLAIRLAADIERRDGYTENLSPTGRDQDDIHSDSYRASILFEPTDYIKNTTVYDYYHAKVGDRAVLANGQYSAPDGSRQYQIISAEYAGLDALFGTNSGGWPVCADPACNVDAAIQRQLVRGPRKTFNPIPFSSTISIWGVTNTTEIDLDVVKIKNIFGLRGNEIYNNNHTDGLDFIVEDVSTYRTDRQTSDEIQLSGSLFQEHLDWLLGAFYLSNVQPGPNQLAFDAYRNPTWYPDRSSPTGLSFFNTVAIPLPGGGSLPAGTVPLGALLNPASPFYNPGSAQQAQFFSDQSRAVFGQLNYHFGGALDGLSLTAGLRYTSDRQEACSENIWPYDGVPVADQWACTQRASASYGRAESNALTWQVGADYKLSDSVFLYVVGRRGYRAGGLNTPALGGTLVGFQTYKPQTVTDVEVGAKTKWQVENWAGAFNIAAFHSTYKSLQRAVTGIPPGIDGDGNAADDPSNTTLYINSKGATVQGVEIDGTIQPTRDLTLSYAGSYLSYSLDPDVAPAALAGITLSGAENAPRWSYSVGADYRLPIESNLGQFYVHGDYYWVHHYLVGETVIPSKAITNFSIDWKEIAGQPISASFFVQNAFDELYTVSSTLSGTAPGWHTVSYGPPRMFGFKIRYDFGPRG